MAAKIVLTVVQGKFAGKQYVFRGRTHCVVGRADCCHPRLPDDEVHRDVSRMHCLLDLNPPHVTVRDLGSRNGTYLNGEMIGQRDPSQTVSATREPRSPEREVKAGDEIRVGNTVFHVTLSMPPTATERRSNFETQQLQPVG
jgi:pSer/pThr/pTyr-binding forkhead associated (FHA) protein